MKEKIFKFNLDVKDKEFKTGFNLVQLDNTSRFIIKLFDDGEPYEMTKEDKVEVAIAKNDGTFVVIEAEFYDNSVTCLLTENALAIPGITKCEVRVLNGSKVLTSASFKIYIRENIVNGEAIKSTSEYKALEGLINEAKIMQESLKKGESVIEDVNKIKENLTEIKESILNKSKEIDDNLAVADEKINLIKTYISKSETAIENLTNNQNKIENLSNLLTELEKIRLTLDEINNSVNKANTQKVELDKSTENAKNEKISLDDSVKNSKIQNTNLKNTITDAEIAESSLEASSQKALNQQVNLEQTITDSIAKNKTLSDTNTKLETLNTSLNTLSENLSLQMTDGNKLKSNLDASTSNAENVKNNLDESIANATSTNITLKATDTQAKKTEALIKDLMNQLNLTKDEVSKIIAAGDLSQYVTDPKLQEVLKSYATKEDLSKIDVTSQLVDYAKKTDLDSKVNKVNGKALSSNDYTNADKTKVDAIPPNPKYTDTTYDLSGYAKKTDIKTKLSEMTSDSTHRTVTDAEKATWNTVSNKVDKVAGKQLSTNDFSNSHKSKVDAIPSSPKYTDTVTTINGKTGAISKADITALGIPSTNTTYGLASQSSNGLMSAADKKRLDNIKEQVALTEAQYNALSSTQQNDSKKIYYIKA